MRSPIFRSAACKKYCTCFHEKSHLRWFMVFPVCDQRSACLHLNLSGIRGKGTKVKELAASANQSTASTLKDVVGLSQKLLNTSTDLSRVDATLRETNRLLQDSSMTSTSWFPFPAGKPMLWDFQLARCTMGSLWQTASLRNKNVLMSRFAFIRRENSLGEGLLLAHFSCTVDPWTT